MAGEADLGHLREAGYVILKTRIESQLVRDARDSIEDQVKGLNTKSTETLWLQPFTRFEDWPSQCKRLCDEVVKNVPYSYFRPGNGSPRLTLAIGVYQPTTRSYRGADKTQNRLSYIVPLDEVMNPSNGLPEYIEGSHVVEDPELPQLPKRSLEINRGDVFVWEGRIASKGQGKGGAAFMLFQWIWD